MHESKQQLLLLSALLFFQIKTHWVNTQLPADLFCELTQKDSFLPEGNWVEQKVGQESNRRMNAPAVRLGAF